MREWLLRSLVAARRAVRAVVLLSVLTLAAAMATAAPHAETPAPAPQRHADAAAIAPTNAPVNATPPHDLAPTVTVPANATATVSATATRVETTIPTPRPSATASANATSIAATNAVPATATANATPNPVPHAVAPENHPFIPTHPVGTPASGTVSPLPSRHPDATLPPMTSGTPITRANVARGIQYTSWWHGEYASAESDRTLAQAFAPLGVNWIAPIVTCYSQTITDTVIDCTGDQTPTDADLTYLIARAHSLGMKVMLKPHIDLKDPNHWRGEISMATSADWTLWFANYRAYITHYAALAQTAGADRFVIGTELGGTSGHDTEWRAVVAAVRGVYTGPITYAANHGEEVFVTWWDALDYIGVDAYYPLTTIANPTVAQLKVAWAPVVSLLGTLSASYGGKPVLFTEVGYQSQAGTNITPWNATTGVLDLQEQTNCYTALFEVFRDLPWWQGVFWWSASPYPDQGGLTDTDFTPINKPAQEVLRNYYGGVGGTPQAVPSRHPDATPRATP